MALKLQESVYYVQNYMRLAISSRDIHGATGMIIEQSPCRLISRVQSITEKYQNWLQSGKK